MSGFIVIGVLALTGPAAAGADGPAVLDLGGVRRVTATVARDADAWVVAVKMAPVRCFAGPTNDALNREKARAFALQALAKRLSADHPVGVTVRGVSIDRAGPEGDVYALTLRVPVAGVAPAGEAKPSTAGTAERAVFTSALFARKGEYATTLDQLGRLLAEDLARAERGDSGSPPVEAVGAAGRAAFQSLADDVGADPLLLTVEKEGLLASVRGRGDAWAARVVVATRFSAVEIDPRFRPILTADPLLMEVTGAKVVDLGGGRRAVLAVASTEVRDGSAGDRLRAEKVCRAKALAAVVADRDGVQVARVEELTERTVVTVDRAGERGSSVSDYLQVTRSRVEGMARDMPVVGRWRSRDGAVFYLAVGAVVGPDGQPEERTGTK